MPPRGEARLTCFFDGACPRNQFGRKGPMRTAFVVGDQEFVRDVPDLPTPGGSLRTNNIAEYHGLIFLLRYLAVRDRQQDARGAYLICGDSELVIRQMRGEYRVKSPHLHALHEDAIRLAGSLDVEFREVPRERNRAGFLLE